jgi:hypothetical protein
MNSRSLNMSQVTNKKKKIPSALLYMDGVPDELTENLP